MFIRVEDGLNGIEIMLFKWAGERSFIPLAGAHNDLPTARI